MTSIDAQFSSIIDTFKNKIEHSSSRQDSSGFQEIVTKNIQSLLELKSKIYNDLSLFSSNESLEDLSTKSIKYLSIDYYLALMFSRKQNITSKDPNSRNKFKLAFLQKSVQLFVQFLVSLQDYGILDPILSKKIDSFNETYNPNLNDLYQTSSADKDPELSNAYSKREQKIEFYKNSKTIEEQLNFLESNSNNDDEALRKLSTLKLSILSYQSFNEIEQILYEVELLQNFSKFEQSNTRERKEEIPSSTEYTDRLETLNMPLLSKNGKILRNFTLVDRKASLQNKVRGYGQYGPTMSVEEFLEKEWESGRVLQGGPEDIDKDNEKDEDNYDWNDKETYKAREWDEFKENNPRGSGNTTNRG
ncbi:hypothetical protein KAFR_0A02230 [Kazachstania africana CBS 2517]|uniref:TAP42-like protein n=1 Tax=Kazachstania africana (strain ATCC 22294 / BCRC 22015 / CBS 2517 / CECT 1963 / NBRC 1671 / NRRL Y-8276) TaxID=1071382 RepID=H2AMR1_KAZAF|nr:hypothetical protein KAFR_0A02230 [Kazachstania africana CBS 2517]CCF55661.1 hypothetical protein KAFR_0A02230 [Kazachstania africana CBS 2517]